MKDVQFTDTIPLEALGNGVSRKIRSYNEDLMLVEVHFEQDGVGAVHKHEHLQATYILEGVFEFTKSGVPVVVRTGDTILFSKNELHGARCLEKGVVLDIFTPYRKDFV